MARSASLIGGCWGAYDLTKLYVFERHQFGAPLIEISAVSTNLAHMVVGIRTAESALRRAVDESELHWCGRLGGATLAVDEGVFWDQLSA